MLHFFTLTLHSVLSVWSESLNLLTHIYDKVHGKSRPWGLTVALFDINTLFPCPYIFHCVLARLLTYILAVISLSTSHLILPYKGTFTTLSARRLFVQTIMFRNSAEQTFSWSFCHMNKTALFYVTLAFQAISKGYWGQLH